MTVSYLLAPIPKWVAINNEGTVAGGASLHTFRSLNKTQEKAVYADPGGTIPYTNPIIFDLNGTQGPFYWSVDSADLSDTYYLELYDSNGNLLWTLDNYFPPGSGGGGGGGGNVTTYIPLKNYIGNSQFINHQNDTGNPIGTTNFIVCASNHHGFTPSDPNPIVGTYGVLGSDTRLVKNNLNATDQVTFPLFLLGDAPLTGDVTPVDYLRYQCTNSPTGETYKSFQFPICQKVKNLSNQVMTFKVWARVGATPATLTLFVRQYFGSGTSASAEVRTTVGTLALTTTWTLFNVSLTIPDVSGKSLGTPGFQTDDDATYLQLDMPLGQPCDIQFCKPVLYLGNINPSQYFDDYDQIDTINLTPRVGDIKAASSSVAQFGWLDMSDYSIGNVGSSAHTAQSQMFHLYKTLWDSVADADAPVSGGRGASAVSDFLANKWIRLPLMLGRALGEAGAGAGLTNHLLGQAVGSEANTMTVDQMPSHHHTEHGTVTFGGPNLAGAVGYAVNDSVTGDTGGGQPFNVVQPTTFFNFYIKW